MDDLTLKRDLLERIRKTDDQALLQQVKALLDIHSGDRWSGLPDAIRASILEGYAQSEQGEGAAHEDVMKKARAWRGR
ncbi:MAG: hypothetical protein QM724_10635 [Flavobacteriales bacterium]